MKKLVMLLMVCIVISGTMCQENVFAGTINRLKQDERVCNDVIGIEQQDIKFPRYFAISSNNESLVKNVSYSYITGKISFKISVPKNTTVSYEVYPTSVVRGKEYGAMLEKITGTVKNTKKSNITKTISVTPGYYGAYKVHAYYGAGRSVYEDTDLVTSYFKGTKYTTKYTWNKKAINRYKRDETICMIMKYGGEIVLSYTCPAVGSGLTFMQTANDIYATNADEYDALSCIVTTPIAGYSYVIERTQNSATSGISQYVLVYNKKGKQIKRIYMGKIPSNRIVKKF